MVAYYLFKDKIILDFNTPSQYFKSIVHRRGRRNKKLAQMKSTHCNYFHARCHINYHKLNHPGLLGQAQQASHAAKSYRDERNLYWGRHFPKKLNESYAACVTPLTNNLPNFHSKFIRLFSSWPISASLFIRKQKVWWLPRVRLNLALRQCNLNM